uniref:Uncharacterized protein n=1 Tax=Strongyloides papillosus TaxID=174720 RepID=A0A0N5BLK8_STREA
MFKSLILVAYLAFAAKAFIELNMSFQFNGILTCNNKPMGNQTVKLYKNKVLFGESELGENKTNSNGEVSIQDKQMIWTNTKVFIKIEHKCGLISNSSCISEDIFYAPKDGFKKVNDTYVWNFEQDLLIMSLLKPETNGEKSTRLITCKDTESSS